MTHILQAAALLLLLLPSKHDAFQIRDIRDVAVIGGGVGGLVSSTLLARTGLKVILVEKNGKCGGRMNSEERIVDQNGPNSPSSLNSLIIPVENQIQGGNKEKTSGNNDINSNVKSSNNLNNNLPQSYRFDVGPSLLLLPDVYEETFQSLGERLSDHVELLKVDPFYRCYFEEDGTFAEICSDQEKMKAIVNGIEANSYEKFTDYLRTASDFLKFGLPTVIQEKPDFTHFGAFLMACIKIFPLLSHENMLQKYFKTEKLQSMMSFQDLYIGLSPYKSPAIFSLLQALELKNGIFYPKGGFQRVAQSLENIARDSGVEIVNNCSVEGIQLTSEDVWRDAQKGGGEKRTIQSLNISIKTKQMKNVIKRKEAVIPSGEDDDENIVECIEEECSLEEECTISRFSIKAKTFITNIDAPEFENMLVRVTHSFLVQSSLSLFLLFFLSSSFPSSLSLFPVFLSSSLYFSLLHFLSSFFFPVHLSPFFFFFLLSISLVILHFLDFLDFLDFFPLFPPSLGFSV